MDWESERREHNLHQANPLACGVQQLQDEQRAELVAAQRREGRIWRLIAFLSSMIVGAVLGAVSGGLLGYLLGLLLGK